MPLRVFQRAYCRIGRRFVPGLLQSMPVRIRDTPPDVVRLYRKIERRLKKRGEKLNLFAHCSETPLPLQRNVGPAAPRPESLVGLGTPACDGMGTRRRDLAADGVAEVPALCYLV